jgi:hypothetical protein
MLTVFMSYGDHSNRLFQNLYYESFCLEYNVRYANPTFRDMHKYYIAPCSINRAWRLMFLDTKWGKKLIKKGIAKVVFYEENDNNPEILKSLIKEYRNVCVSGWMMRVPALLKKYQDCFIEKYSLKEDYYKGNVLLKKINELKKKDKIIVGVHIRRGDYKEFFDGKWYFTDQVYMKYMNALQEEIYGFLCKDCTFMIFSNEKTSFREEGNICVSHYDWYIDHHLMTQCDMLIGPPSTFTSWASYIGKTKYFHINDDTGDISLDRFVYRTN